MTVQQKVIFLVLYEVPWLLREHLLNDHISVLSEEIIQMANSVLGQWFQVGKDTDEFTAKTDN